MSEALAKEFQEIAHFLCDPECQGRCLICPLDWATRAVAALRSPARELEGIVPEVEEIARAINRARYPDDRAPRELADEDQGSQGYARRLARAVSAMLAASPAPPSSGEAELLAAAANIESIALNAAVGRYEAAERQIETMKRALEQAINAAEGCSSILHQLAAKGVDLTIQQEHLWGGATGATLYAREALSSLAKHTGEVSEE